MAIGDLVLHLGRPFRLIGIDPMSVTERHADLEDLETGERIRVPLETIEPDAPNTALRRTF